ncbi:MAG: AsmA family protein [Gallionella sp.]|nr:AsmA family protein [Gallionella sp.]
MKAIRNSALGLAGIVGLVVLIFGVKVPFAESLAKEYWRYGLTALLLITLMIPLAFGLFIYLVDANRFKAEIVRFVKVQTQRELVLQGDIKLTIFPKLGLDSGKMSLSQRNSAREFASVNNARLYIAWLPLLKKQLVFDRVVIDGMRANVTRLKDGTTNFDDLLIRDENLAPMTFDVDGVRVTNSSINWTDDMGSQHIAIRDLQLETGRLADTVPSYLKASFQLNSESQLNSEMAPSDVKVELKSSLFFDHKAGRYELADIEGTMAGAAAGINNLTVGFKGNLDTYPAQGSLTAENISTTMTGKYGQRNIDVKLGIPRLQIGKNSLSGSQLTIDATLSQPGKTLAAETSTTGRWTTLLQLPAFEITDKILKAAEFSADFDFKGEGRTLQGKLASPLSLSLSVIPLNTNRETAPRLQLDNIALSFAAKHPALSGELAATATGSVQADFAAQNASLAFKAKIDDSVIAGSAVLKDFSHPAYSFELNANRLDLDSYIAADWIKRFQDDAMPLDFGGIKDMKLSGRLRAGEFKMAKLIAGKLAADIRIEQSTLTLAPLSANFYGGALMGSISVAAQAEPQIMLKQNLRGFQMGALLADTSSAGKLSGKGDLVMYLRAEGGTVGALRKSLNGSVSLALAHGSLAGIDLRSALLGGKNELGNPGDARTHLANFTEKTEFSELKAAFNIKDGSPSANSLEMKSQLMRTAGDGEIALDSGNINYRLNATVASALNRRTAGELADLKGVTVPVGVSGPWATPTISLDFATASGDLVAKRIAAKAAAEQAAAKVAAEQAAVKAAAAKHNALAKKRVTKAIKNKESGSEKK